MAKFINRLGWVIVTAVLVSAFWIFYFGISGAPVSEREVTKAGEKITLDPGAQPPVTLADARASLELVTALYTSARTGSSVTLPQGRDAMLYEGWAPAEVAG